MSDTDVKKCSVDGCGDKIHSKGLCNKHYHQRYHQENIEKIRIRKIKYYQENTEKLKITQERYYQKNNKKLREKNKRYSRTSHGIFYFAGKAAKRRNKPFNLNEEQFHLIRNKNCYYCDKPNNNETGIGLDRIENNRGYEIDNVLPCCSACNMTRGDNWTVEETKIMIAAVMAHRAKKAA